VVIILVDDEQFLLEMGKELLGSRHGFEVDLANSANEGLAMFKEVGHDVIISDFQMPGMNGIEFLRSLRTKGEHVPFILFTGRGREEVAGNVFHHGADYYLRKEGSAIVQYAELANMVERSTIQRKME
jgi:DNA-binding response OmpR family regulator